MNTIWTLEWLTPNGGIIADSVDSSRGGVLHLAPPAGAKIVEMRMTIPLTDVNGIWRAPPNRATLQKVTWTGKEVAGPYCASGLIAFVDRSLRNVAALLPLPAAQESITSWQLNQARGEYCVTIQWVEQDGGGREVLFCGDPLPVHEVARQLHAAVPHDAMRDAAEAVYEPSYCTWYAFHGALEQAEVMRCARLARDIGFGCFIIDDGWMYDAAQRVTGPIGAWNRGNGDYVPSKRKFPDFDGFVKNLAEIGLRRLLWVAPFMVGGETESYRRFGPRLLSSWLDEGFACIDPRQPDMVAHLVEKMSGLAQRYAIDGFKVDYDYALLGPGREARGLGDAYSECVKRLIAAVRKVNPQFEWNLIPNPFSCSVTNAFRCVDVPYDPETNRMVMASFKAVVGRAALHYDPSLWRPDSSLETLHRHMAPSVFCVPSVGADILRLPEEHRHALRQWLGFYRRHQRVLAFGEFLPVWAAGDIQSFHASLNGKRVSCVFSEFPVDLPTETETWLLNAGTGSRVHVDCKRSVSIAVEDLDGMNSGAWRTLRKGGHRVAVPIGGVVHVRAVRGGT